MDFASEKLSLHQLTVDEARAVLRREKAPGMEWAEGFPSFEHIDFLKAFVADATGRKDPGPFGLYLVVVNDGNIVIGGAGFVGPPDGTGAVEIVVELEPAARKLGYGGETFAAIIEVARANGASAVTTSTSVANVPGQRAIERGGLVEVSRDDWIVYYSVDLKA